VSAAGQLAVAPQEDVGVGLGLLACFGCPVAASLSTTRAVTETWPEVGDGLMLPDVLLGLGDGDGEGVVGFGVGVAVGLGCFGVLVGAGDALEPLFLAGDGEQLGDGDGEAPFLCCPPPDVPVGVPVPATVGACPPLPEPFPPLDVICCTWEMIVCGSPVRTKPPTNATTTMTPMAAASRSHG
jgi:hypothetical protein